MSFVVSQQGQFRPYELPDLTHFDRVHHIYKSLQAQKLKDGEDHYEFEKNFKNPKEQKSSQESKLKAYHKLEKAYELDKKPHHARDIMSHPPHCIGHKQTWRDAFDTMEKYTYRHLPVIDDESHLVGMVSDRDLLKHRGENPSKALRHIMSDNVLTAMESARIQDVVRIMLHEKIGALPIINDKYGLTGILTQTDILKVVATGQIPL